MQCLEKRILGLVLLTLLAACSSEAPDSLSAGAPVSSEPTRFDGNTFSVEFPPSVEIQPVIEKFENNSSQSTVAGVTPGTDSPAFSVSELIYYPPAGSDVLDQAIEVMFMSVASDEATDAEGRKLFELVSMERFDGARGPGAHVSLAVEGTLIKRIVHIDSSYGTSQLVTVWLDVVGTSEDLQSPAAKDFLASFKYLDKNTTDTAK